MALTYVFEVKDNGSATFQKINANVNVLNQSLIKVDNSTNIVNKSLGFLKTSVATALGSGIAHGVAMLKDLTKEMVDNYDSAAKLSQNIGITAESVLGLRHAAELSAVGSAEMDKNMERLSKTMYEAASGNKTAGDSFKQLGIAVTNSDGTLKKSDQVLMEMADKFKALPPGAERAAAAMNIFGKSGASMVSMLKDGSGALKKMVDEGAGAAGNVQSIADSMEKLNDAGTRAKAALMGMLAEIVDSSLFNAMVSGFNSISEALIKWNAESKKEVEQEREANKERMATLLYTKAQLKQIPELTDKQKALQQSVQKELEATNVKLKLGNDEMKLMLAKANIMALLDKMRVNSGKLAAEDMKELEKWNNVIKDIEKKETTSVIKPKVNDEAKKAYEAEMKRLQDWRDNYEKSKRTENEIAAASYNEKLENFEKLYERKKITLDEYNDYTEEAENDFNAKLKEIADKQTDERLKKEEATQSKVWELRRIAARSSGDIAEIEIEQIRVKYDKEIKMAEDAKISTVLIKQAEQAEIDAIMQKSIESERQQQELMRSYRETAAQTDAERIAIQMESINAKYDAELEKHKENADMQVEIVVNWFHFSKFRIVRNGNHRFYLTLPVVNWFHFSKFRIVRNFTYYKRIYEYVVNWFHFSKFRIVRNLMPASLYSSLVVNWFHFSKFRIVRNLHRTGCMCSRL